jgi:ElaB/YqjD/DUF883 family membrane-anchored ribosome-binding protein
MTAAASGKRLEALRGDIEQTRAAMDATLDALVERVRPSSVASRFGSEIQDALARAVRPVVENPGVAVGLALLAGFLAGRLAGRRGR